MDGVSGLSMDTPGVLIFKTQVTLFTKSGYTHSHFSCIPCLGACYACIAFSVIEKSDGSFAALTEILGSGGRGHDACHGAPGVG